MPAPTLALVEIETHRGVSAAELLARRADSQRWISASALERWLVESGFAETNGEPGRLVPTQLAIEVGGLLFPSDRVVRLGRDFKVSRWLVCPNPSKLAARARAWVERTCREQGIPVTVSDPAHDRARGCDLPGRPGEEASGVRDARPGNALLFRTEAGRRIDAEATVIRRSAASAILGLLFAIVLAACDTGHAAQRGPFEYDEGAPLDIRVISSRVDGDVRISKLTYASPKGGRVPALLFVPSGGGPFAGLIAQHGLPGSKENAVFRAELLAKLGVVVIAIDAPFARRSGAPLAFTRRDRAEQIQLIVDLRRAVDLLRARTDVDDDRIAYLGVSYGASMGGLLAGVEHPRRHGATQHSSSAGTSVSQAAGTQSAELDAAVARPHQIAAPQSLQRTARGTFASSMSFSSCGGVR